MAHTTASCALVTPTQRRLLKSAVLFGVVSALVWLLHGKLPRLVVPPHPVGWLVALSAAAIAVSYVSAAVALRAAAGRRLRWSRTVLVQLAAALANRLVPAGLGGVGVNLRYLHKAGVAPLEAGFAVALVSLGSGFATVLVAAVAFPMAATSLRFSHLIPIAATILGGVALLAVAAFLGRGRLPAMMQAHGVAVGRAAVALCHNPARLAFIVVGSLGVKLAHIIALLAALAAFGSSMHAPVVIAVYLVGSAAASAVPTPSGLGAVEAALVTGLHAAGGPLSIVIGGVLVFRLASFWMPIIPGAAATWLLRRSCAV